MSAVDESINNEYSQQEVLDQKIEGDKDMVNADATTESTEEDAMAQESKNSKPLTDAMKFFVGGIRPDAWDDDLRGYFQQFGTVKEVQVMKDHVSGRNRGFGFVTMDIDTNPDDIFKKEHIIKTKRVEVREMQPDGTSNLRRKIFVGGINPAVNEEHLGGYFKQFGAIEKITIMRDLEGKSRGFGFLVYVVETNASKALKKTIHNIDHENKVEVRAAEARSRSSNIGKGRGMPPPPMPPMGRGAMSPYAPYDPYAGYMSQYYGRGYQAYPSYTPAPPPGPPGAYMQAYSPSAYAAPINPVPDMMSGGPMSNSSSPYPSNNSSAYWMQSNSGSSQLVPQNSNSANNNVSNSNVSNNNQAMAAYTAAYGQHAAAYAQPIDAYGPQRGQPQIATDQYSYAEGDAAIGTESYMNGSSSQVRARGAYRTGPY